MNERFQLLVRHFLRRLAANDLVSPNADSHASLALVLAFLVVPNLLGSMLLVFRYGNTWITPCQAVLLGLDDKLAFLTTSMVLIALATVVEWDALSLDARDHAILGPLPIPTRTLVGAKLASLGVFVALLAALVNVIPTVFFPFLWLMALPVGLTVGVRVMAVHALVSLASAVCAFAAVLAIRGLLVTTLPPRLFRLASTAVQFVAILGLVTGFLLSPGLYHNVGKRLASGSRLVYAAPPVGFLGLYEHLATPLVVDHPNVVSGKSLRGWQEDDEAAARRAYLELEPAFGVLGGRAVLGLGTALALALGLFSLSHFRRLLKPSAAGAAGSWLQWRRRTVAALASPLAGRHPIARATFFFTLLTLARSASHRLYVAAYLAGGIAMAVATRNPAVVPGSAAQGGQLGVPEPGLLALQLVLALAFLVGVRVGFPIPAELTGNWVFRVTEGSDLRPAFAGARRAFRAIALGFLLLFVPLHAVLWGWSLAARHWLAGAAVALLLIEAMTLGFQKVPYTSSYVPGNGNLRYTWPLYLFLFWTSTYLLATIEHVALPHLRSFAVFLLVLATLTAALAAERRRRLRGLTGQVFDEVEERACQTLGLTP